MTKKTIIGANKREVVPGGFATTKQIHRTSWRSAEVREAAHQWLNRRSMIPKSDQFNYGKQDQK